MAELELNGEQIGAGFQQVGGKAMAHGVGGDRLRDLCVEGLPGG